MHLLPRADRPRSAPGARILLQHGDTDPPIGGGSDRAARRRRGGCGYFVSAVKLMSQAAFALLITALTSADLTSGGLSHVQGMTPAVPVTILSIAAHAFARCAGSTSTSAFAIALLICGSLSCGQFELSVALIALPLNVGSS